MAEEKKETVSEETEPVNETVEKDTAENTESCCGEGKSSEGCGGKKKKCGGKHHAELEAMAEELAAIKKQRDELQDKYMRIAAEYDNFRKRTSKEKESIYSDAYANALKEIFPIIDNLERAAAYEDGAGVAEGVKMTLNQSKASLEKLGVEPIPAEVGEPFNPEIHNAVMVTENPELGEGVIAAVFQRGYRKGDKVLRFAMVSVTN